MGLYISHIDSVTIKSERSLYIYLLDYGWPDGHWEQLFKRHFMRMADRASQTGAVVIGSMRGVHFGNDVLNWHRVGNLNADEVLPGLMITKTHPSYFKESFDEATPAAPGLRDLIVIPLKSLCDDETDFLRAIESVFSDLERGLELKNFQIATHDARASKSARPYRRLANAFEAKPGAFGFSIDLKALLFEAK
jgi:hypothetical protein